MVFIIFTATLSDLLEQLMDIRADTTGPERLVREAAQGHADAVKDIVTKHPDKVSSASHFKLCIYKLYQRISILKYVLILFCCLLMFL